MAIAAGTRLGPFEILAPLGAGGMGEVYRARDTRLGREVAVKVLSAEFAADADRKKRFEQEARAASALNHPNIVTIHDIGTEGDTVYIAMEYVDGRTLREVVGAGALPTRRLLDLSYQLADGLAKAHAAGIVHRDLKPENVMVSKDGALKILDFGLAKLLKEQPDQVTNAPTAQATQAGTVMGTVGYMSPEQASGRPLDYRTDQFSMGSIFYEMATGRRAFQRGTQAETLTAIIREDTEPVAQLNGAVPAPFRWIVERCLQKDPEERYASTRDLARDVRAVREHLSEAPVVGSVSGASPVSAGRPRRRWLAWIAGTAALVAAFGAGAWTARRFGRITPPSFQQITFGSGTIQAARFAPDGQTIVYSASWDGNPRKLFLKHPSSPEALPLELPSANLLSISPTGEMAIDVDCRGTHPSVCAGTLARAALTGGAPRDVAEGVQEADWASDATSLMIVRDVGGKARIEFPIGKVLFETTGYVSDAKLSRDNKRIAFVDHPFSQDDSGVVSVLELDGKMKKLTQRWNKAGGLAWSPSGDEIWFTATDTGANLSLYAVTLSGSVRVIVRVPGGIRLQDVARNGRVLLARGGSRVGTLGMLPGDTRERDLSWLDYSFVGDISADGKTLLFDEEGEAGGANYTVYLRKSGSPVVKLGEGAALSLSPDTQWALAALSAPNPSLVLLPTGAGQPRRLEIVGVTPSQSGAWLPDSKTLLIAGNAEGHGVRLWTQSIDGGQPKGVTIEGIDTAFPGFAVSPDGRFVAAIGPDDKGLLFPIEGGEPRPIGGLVNGEFPLRFSQDGKSIYVWKRDLPARVYTVDLASGRHELWKELMPIDPSGVERISNVVVTPDGKSYAYTYSRLLSDLFVVEGLK
jgi:Tol biopolymer transport system component/predicted Ser/Thr protein kinase